MHTEKHAIVVGGGIVGSVQALLLARTGYRVTLVDASPVSAENLSDPTPLSVRTVAMSCRSQQLLQSAGLWNTEIGCPIYSVHVNDKGRFGSVRFDHRDYSVPALGYVVRNSQLENHLIGLLHQDSAIEVVKPATAEVTSISSDCAEVVIDDGKGEHCIVADLLVAADGTQSGVRSQLGIDVLTTDYEQHALVANLECQRDHNNVAYERFTDSGPLAMLPLDRRMVSMVCTFDSAGADALGGSSSAQLLAEVQQRFGGRLGRFQRIGRHVMFPLSLVRAAKQVHGCAVLVGNASITLHPVAGQGLNLALRDVFALAASLGGKPDVADSLQAFASDRKSDQQFVVRQTDLLARWFRKHRLSGLLPHNAVKSASLLMLDATPLLRNKFGRRSAGLDIPLHP